MLRLPPAIRTLPILVLLGACDGRDRSSFPDLPRTDAALAALVQAETRRPPPPQDPPLDAAAILAAADARGLASLPSGRAAIARWIQAALDRAPGRAYLLFGTFHDAPGQLDAFRRLLGPAGLTGIELVGAEQFRADGAWRGVRPEIQRGDGALLDRFAKTGDRAAFAELLDRHRDGDYAAWKLGYEETALDLLIAARDARVRFVGCDMPAPLAEIVGAIGDQKNRLREIHCLRSLPAARRVALIWGDAHVRPNGIVRFLPPDAEVVSIHAFGQRMGGGIVEPLLAAKLVVDDPVLVPLGDRDAALLLPDATLGGQVDRVLTAAEGVPATGADVRSEVEGTFAIAGTTVPVTRASTPVPLAPGTYTYALRAGEMRVVGAVTLRPGHRVELGFDPAARTTSYVEREGR